MNINSNNPISQGISELSQIVSTINKDATDKISFLSGKNVLILLEPELTKKIEQGKNLIVALKKEKSNPEILSQLEKIEECFASFNPSAVKKPELQENQAYAAIITAHCKAILTKTYDETQRLTNSCFRNNNYGTFSSGCIRFKATIPYVPLKTCSAEAFQSTIFKGASLKELLGC